MKQTYFGLFITLILLSCHKQETPATPISIQKNSIHGLVTMGSTKDLRNGNFEVLKEANVHPDIYSGVVIKTTWGDLEPQRGEFNFATIQTALHDIQTYNNEHPNHPLKAKLRISTTINTPSWVLNLANGPVDVVIDSTISYPVALFWTQQYRQAWKELQIALAQQFDTHKLIQEVCVTAPAMATDEPLATIFNQETIYNLKQKGFTDEAFKEVLEGVIEDYACWQYTYIDYSFNIHRKIDSGIQVKDTIFTKELMQKFLQTFPDRAVFSNHGLRQHLTPGAEFTFRNMKLIGQNIAAQTKSPHDLSDQTFEVGLSYGVTEFEIWDSQSAGGYAHFDTNDLLRWKSIIENGF